MKKTLIGVLAIATILVICSGIVFAADAKGGWNSADDDNDVVCDNYEDNQCKANTQKSCTQKNCTDDNNDAVCDSYEENQCKEIQCKENRQENCVKEVNDNVCDNYEEEHCRKNRHENECENECEEKNCR